MCAGLIEVARLVANELRSELGGAVASEVKTATDSVERISLTLDAESKCKQGTVMRLGMREVHRVAHEFSRSSAAIGRAIDGVGKV